MVMEADRLATKKALEQRTRAFGVAVLRLIDALPPSTSTFVVGRQLAKSATSIGANYREANRGESYDDFLHKMGIALKEASETVFWLETMHDLYADNAAISGLLEEALQLLKIFQASNRTLRENSLKQAKQRTSNTKNQPNQQFDQLDHLE